VTSSGILVAVVRGELAAEADWLTDLDVDASRPSGGGVVPGHAKGDAPWCLSDLITQLLRLLLLPPLLQAISIALWSWLGRRRGRSIGVALDDDSLELTGASTAQLGQLIEVQVKRYAGEG
jgi:hypothetical protein